MYEIEILTKKGFKNSHGEHTLSEINGIGIKGVESVEYSQVYRIKGEITKLEAQKIASELLSDKITETYKVSATEPAGCNCSCVNSQFSIINSQLSVI
jgi:phosphoribosylformylglycinamidine synthase